MFGGKQLEEIKEISKSHSDSISELKELIEANRKDISEMKELVIDEITEMNKKNEDISIRLDDELGRLVKMAGEFERSVASFNNIKNRLDDALYKRIQDIAESELMLVRKKLTDFKGIEEDFTKLVAQVNRLESELGKFNKITANINEVDFSLQKHARDLQMADKRKLQLERENDMLKSLMAKMKRNQRRSNLR